ncbi:hypothetical protein A7K93_00910 [Candidatus Methylacidiphilum fumarolicum]|nr:hypothetical protein A7K73_04995 [Candidatus Methylacidiphilum fumarolicum]TFE73771.1 hypothetical protein A7K72_05595 [Candidatus Methylacidiphilum fumarolicum]TFE75622.1 hypothetical protein A7K93_00910 [Candidatus Methylacidiphilum fumarolicum]
MRAPHMRLPTVSIAGQKGEDLKTQRQDLARFCLAQVKPMDERLGIKSSRSNYKRKNFLTSDGDGGGEISGGHGRPQRPAGPVWF